MGAMRTTTDWTMAEKAVVKEGRRRGLSARAIATKLPGRTRNAVVALAHREGYDTPVPARFGGKGVRKNQGNQLVSLSPVLSKPLPPPPPPPAIEGMRAVRLEDLEAQECRFPVGEEKSIQLFCGAPGHPWCAHHRAIVYRKDREEAA